MASSAPRRRSPRRPDWYLASSCPPSSTSCWPSFVPACSCIRRRSPAKVWSRRCTRSRYELTGRMSPQQLDYTVAGILWLAVVAYATLAGADFGGGVWDLFARGPRATDQRRAVQKGRGPVWEANHVWLIFMITGLFTGFPTAFGVLGLALYLPFTIAMAGIVLRGASFAFRAHAADVVGPLSTWGVV